MDRPTYALLEMLPKINSLTNDPQLRVLWLLLIATMAEMEIVKAMLDGKEPPDNSELFKKLDNELNEAFSWFLH